MHFDNYGFDYDVGMDCSNNTGGNNTDGNNTGGNNTGCGYDANYSSVYAVVYYYQYVNQTITASMSVNCEILNSSMFMNYWIYDSNNYTMAGNNQSWTGSNSSSFSWTTQGLSTGNYTFHADLYVNGTWVDSDEVSFYVTSNNTGSSAKLMWVQSWAPQNGSYSQISWEAYNLVNNTNYNVTFGLWEYDNASNNLTMISTMNYTTFNSSSSSNAYFAYDAYNSTAGGSWTNTYTPIGCYYVLINLVDNDNGLILDNYGFDYDVGMNCSNTAGNNSGTMEWIEAWPGSTNYSTNDIINISWSAGDLVTNITYNVTVDIYAYNATTNTTYVIYNNYTVFTATSNASTGVMGIPSNTLPVGCYFASIDLYDNTDGMHFDNDGFDLDVGMDCSGGSGNNSGTMEWIEAWPGSINYTTEDILQISWNANDLVTNITYNVTLDIYAHNPTTNTTYVIYNNYTVFTATSNADIGWWNIPNETLAAGCYFASIGLYDNTDGMHFDNDGFDLGVETDCSNTGGNNTGGNTSQSNDTDMDGFDDIVDNCPYLVNADQVDLDGDGYGDLCDSDIDGDGVINSMDDCLNGDSNWISVATTDYDSDGCQDSSEDLDDDNDGVLDANDDCQNGNMNWTSTNEDKYEATDYDYDGCQDISEDLDDDNDGVLDTNDSCTPQHDGSWFVANFFASSPENDYDSDGCHNLEDLDADNDGVFDNSDSCPKGDLGWTSTSANDADTDGCRDATEDPDFDGNGTGDGNNTDETWEEACEIWEYWNPDLVDTTLPGNGCPDYIDESSTEDEDDESSGGLPSIGVIGTLAAIGVSFVAVIRREQE